ncbi:TIGR00296 family protein [Candidatus Woesearchaeota archaeon]|nr:TIGR00296 family protein [Candidatus Woesearchaeota archaeon]
MYTEQDGKIFIAYVRDVLRSKLFLKKKSLILDNTEKRGVFVTITKNGKLRGCVGFPYAVFPLKQALADAVVYAAFEDGRFSPITCDEFNDLKFEVTILSKPQEFSCKKDELVSRIKVGVHGLIVKLGVYSGLLLPQVATEYSMTSLEFLENTCMKAGLSKDSWEKESCHVYSFEGQIFRE